MSLLREPVYMRTIVATPGQYQASGVVGSMLVTAADGSIGLSEAFAITNTILEVKSEKGLYIAEASTVEAAGVPVNGGGRIFVSDGKLKYRGTTGTVTTLADA